VELLERAGLVSALREWWAGPGGVVVFVSGEAGIGKSALVRSFCAGLPAGTAVQQGSCDALDAPRALGPPHDIARTSADGLGRLLHRPGERHALFTAFLDLLAEGPSVAVVEDAHWADEATADLLQFGGRRVARCRRRCRWVRAVTRPAGSVRDGPVTSRPRTGQNAPRLVRCATNNSPMCSMCPVIAALAASASPRSRAAKTGSWSCAEASAQPSTRPK
jgi:hypothetical protein